MHRKLTKIFKCAVNSVNPGHLIRSGVIIHKNEVNIYGNIFDVNANYHIIGFGKAVSSMASALQDILQHRVKSGVLSVPANSLTSTVPPITVYFGGVNNRGDSISVRATNEIIDLVQTVPSRDVIIVLVSGGGSSLLCKPVDGITLEDKNLVVTLLSNCGADIRELNIVRKKLSAVKGGKLGYHLNRTQTVCLILSDIIGDPLDLIASGPTVPDNDSPFAALDVIKKYKLELKMPGHILNVISRIGNGPKLTYHSNITNILIGNNTIAMNSAIELEETEKCRIFLLSSEISGMVTDVSTWYSKISEAVLTLVSDDNARAFFDVIRGILRERKCKKKIIAELMLALKDKNTEMVCLLMGGETTLKIEGSGKGGRNQELAVQFAQSMHSLKERKPGIFNKWDVSLLSAGTDGIDGPTDAAGGIGCAELIDKALKADLDVNSFLANNDTYSFLSQIDHGKYFIRTGHTGTNVMDIHILGFYKKLQVSVSSKM